MTDVDRLRVRRRPLAERERADLERQALESERFVVADWTRALRRWTSIGIAVLVIFAALAWAAVSYALDRTQSAAVAAGGAVAFAAFAGWDLRHARTKVRRLRDAWSRTIQTAGEQPVVEIELRPARAWGAGDTGWIFDVGGGRALYADWDLPLGSPTGTIVAAVSPAGGVWFDQSGAEIESEPFPYSWEDVRDDHPMLETQGPATFRLEADAGSSFRDFLEPEWLVPAAKTAGQ